MTYFLKITYVYGGITAGKSPSVSIETDSLEKVNKFIEEFQSDKSKSIQCVECIRGEKLHIETKQVTETRQIVTGRTFEVK